MTKNITNSIFMQQLEKYEAGSVKNVFLYKGNILKLPKHFDIFRLEEQNSGVNELYKHNKYLSGVNQILTEINIWEEGKFNDILCPILEYGVTPDNILFSLNQKIVPANHYINEKDFDLAYFCRQLSVDYKSLADKIKELSLEYDLDRNDLIENEDNFGVDTETGKILILDYGCRDCLDYSNNKTLFKNNMILLDKLKKI